MIVYRVLPQSLLFKENATFRIPGFFHGGHVRWSMILCQSNAVKHCRNGSIQYQKKKQKRKKSKPISKRKPELSNEEAKSLQKDRNCNEDDCYGSTVNCRVDVISWRERHITASIVINAHEQSVWDVLTDYERLAEFIPNLVCSKRIPCPHPDRIWVMQRGVQRALYWHIEAQVVLDLQELPDLVNGRELHFAMVDGDFKQYEGKWSLRSGPRPRTTILYYEVNVKPRFNFPAIFVERVIRTDLPLNLRAVAARAESKSGTSLKMLPCQKKSPSSPETVPPTSNNTSTDTFPVKRVPSESQKVKALYCEMDHQAEYDDVEDNQSTATLIKLSTISISDLSDVSNDWGATGKACRLDRPCVVDEVHLRRLDDLLENGGVHRSVIATITVNAPSRKVWNALTAYESLPEFVPNLAISKIIFRESNKVRLLQEGCKGLLYMVLQARVVLDLWECPEHEIQFEQVEGDFDSFRGKWVFEQLGSQHTLLKYVVETKIQKNCLLAEAIVEEVIYEDLPSNLCAIRDRVEIKENADMNHSTRSTNAEGPQVQNSQYGAKDSNFQSKDETANGLNVLCDKPTTQRPKVAGLQQDKEILKYELSKFIAKYGQEGFMPMRKHIRLHGRVDLEKAITRMGGFRHIASLMNLSLSYKNRKPKGYWDCLENLKQEVSQFQRIWGMDPYYMPSRKSFERAGRFDLARALEKWGGLHEVSRLLMLKVRHTRRSE